LTCVFITGILHAYKNTLGGNKMALRTKKNIHRVIIALILHYRRRLTAFSAAVDDYGII
jgi:hypothetical protein